MNKRGIGVLGIVLVVAVTIAVVTSLYFFSSETLLLAPRGSSLDASGGNQTHLECVGLACKPVAGGGNDSCNSDADCQPANETYLKCIDLSCIEVAGNDTNECDFVGQACGGNQTFPDLIIANLTIDVQLVEGNGTGNETFYQATVFVTVKNIGDASTGTSFRTEIDVSSFSPRNISTSALAPGQGITIIDVYSPIDEGNYNVTSFADILFQITESNESNNAFGPIFFTVP